MKAVVFHKPKDMRVETVDDPSLEDGRDVIVRVPRPRFAAQICTSTMDFFLKPSRW
jgi:threonine dehydrogenase-like Zn-dependent dehydrogenase